MYVAIPLVFIENDLIARVPAYFDTIAEDSKDFHIVVEFWEEVVLADYTIYGL
jgi:hypothetical protein